MTERKTLRIKRPASVCDMAHMSDEPNATDVLGSWTGMAQDGDAPVQDADDL